MKMRVLIAVPLMALAFALIFVRGWVFYLILTSFSLAAQYEMHSALRRGGYPTCMWPGLVYYLAMPLLWYLGQMPLVVGALLLCVIFLQVRALFRPTEEYKGMLASVYALLYPGMFFLTLLFLANVGTMGDLPQELDAEALGATALSLAIFAPSLCDTFALFVGMALGKHKLIAHISPKKTVEGAIAGLVGGVVAGLILYYLMEGLLHSGLALWHYLLLGFINAVFGQFGDLVASQAKRVVGVKDFSTILPGHGGVMDRVDSILFGGIGTLCYLLLVVL